MSNGSGRFIVIMGNGKPERDMRAEVDAADLVIRFNGCRNHGGASGTRSDVVAVCNTGQPASAMLGGGWADLAPVRAAATIWAVRNPEAFASRRADILARRPDLADFFDDRTADFAAMAEAAGKAFLLFDAAVQNRLDAALAPLTDVDYVVPSSGLLVIEHVLGSVAAPEDDVAIAGFGHAGWSGHPFAAERRLIDRFEHDGRLRRL
jgi:hypothetical protein